MAQTTPDAEQIVRSYVDVWNTGDEERLSEVLSESAAVHDPGAPDGVVHGRDEFEAFLREIRAGFPDFSITVDEMLSADEVVMLEWSASGTHEGEYSDIPPTGREFELSGMSKILVADGTVREDRIYYDFHEFLTQLGLVEG